MQVDSNPFIGNNQLTRSGFAAQIKAKLTYIYVMLGTDLIEK